MPHAHGMANSRVLRAVSISGIQRASGLSGFFHYQPIRHSGPQHCVVDRAAAQLKEPASSPRMRLARLSAAAVPPAAETPRLQPRGRRPTRLSAPVAAASATAAAPGCNQTAWASRAGQGSRACSSPAVTLAIAAVAADTDTPAPGAASSHCRVHRQLGCCRWGTGAAPGLARLVASATQNKDMAPVTPAACAELYLFPAWQTKTIHLVSAQGRTP
eukprot:362201-Chlamydomonas_euryale.AAC.2